MRGNLLILERSLERNSLIVPVNILIEGSTDEYVARRLLTHVGLAAGHVRGGHGKADLLRLLSNYNSASRFAPWFVLLDLDNDALCASQAIGLWLPKPEAGIRFRVAVRSIEAWILADRENLATFLHVSSSRLPANPDAESNPKETLINIARARSSRGIREDIVPRQGSGVRMGIRYVERLRQFIENHWQPGEAANRSDSLRRCIHALGTLKDWNNRDTDDN